MKTRLKSYFFAVVTLLFSTALYADPPVVDIPVAADPNTLVLSADAAHLYVTHGITHDRGGAIEVISLSTHTVDSIIDDKDATTIIPAKDNRTVYVGTTHSIYAYDLLTQQKLWNIDPISVFSMTLSPDQKSLYVAGLHDYDVAQIKLIDVEKGVVTSHQLILKKTLTLFNITSSPDGKHIYVASMPNGELNLLTLDTARFVADKNPIVATVDLGPSPLFDKLVISKDGHFAYAITFDGKLQVVDLSTQSIVADKCFDAWISDLIVSDDGKTAYLSTALNHEILLLDTQTWDTKGTIPLKAKTLMVNSIEDTLYAAQYGNVVTVVPLNRTAAGYKNGSRKLLYQ